LAGAEAGALVFGAGVGAGGGRMLAANTMMMRRAKQPSINPFIMPPNSKPLTASLRFAMLYYKER
jgi:hypothetical protein